MTKPFAPKKPPPQPPEPPTKTRLETAGAIRDMIIHGRKLFSVKSTTDKEEFDYRVWISEYRETHIMGVINGNSIKLGELIPSSDGYVDFWKAAWTAAEVPDEWMRTAGRAQDMIHKLWQSIDLGCKVPTNLEVWVYE